MPGYIFLGKKAFEAMVTCVLPGIQVDSALVMSQSPIVGKVLSTELAEMSVDFPYKTCLLIRRALQSVLVHLAVVLLHLGLGVELLHALGADQGVLLLLQLLLKLLQLLKFLL